MGIFDKKDKNQSTPIDIKLNQDITKESVYGGEITSIKKATSDLYFKPERKDPAPFIIDGVRKNKEFYGFIHSKNEEDRTPFYIDESETTQKIFFGSTGTGKGVRMGQEIVMNYHKNIGLILSEPKGDAFAAQICTELFESNTDTKRKLHIATWPNRMLFDFIHETDSYKEIANKLITLLGYEKSPNPGVDHYRRLSRGWLTKCLKYLFDFSLGVHCKKSLTDIHKLLKHLKNDLIKRKTLIRELSKSVNAQNFPLVEKCRKTYYDAQTIDELDWSETDADTSDSVVSALDETIGGVNFYKDPDFDINDIYDNAGILYIKLDAMDEASTNFQKMINADTCLQAKKRFESGNEIKGLTLIIDEAAQTIDTTTTKALALSRGWNLQFILFTQDRSQLGDLEGEILENCNIVAYYKTKSLKNIDALIKTNGKIPVTTVASNEGGLSITQSTEDYINPTKIRALPRAGVYMLQAEFLPSTIILSTDFILTRNKFDWTEFNKAPIVNIADKLNNVQKPSEVRFNTNVTKQKIEGIKSLEDSDLFGFKFESEKLDF